MTRFNRRGAGALVASAILLLGACTSGDDDDATDATDTTDDTGEAPSGELGTGVTEDSIKVAYTFVDTDALQEVGIEVFHGPYADIMTSLVDQLNTDGGINGRTVELVNLPYNPAGGNTESLATCATATEDEQVFAVLGGLQGETNLCIVEQNATVLVGGAQTQAFLDRARAPWATAAPAPDVSVQALVQALDAEGKLDDATVAVYGLEQDRGTIDAATQALDDAGVEVAFEAVNDADPADRTAIDALDATLAQRMKDEGVDGLIIAGSNVPFSVFDQNDFHPALWVAENSILSVFAGQSDNADAFPEVLAVGGAPPQAVWESEPLQECLATYEEASGETLVSPDDATEDNQSPYTAMADACNNFLIFTAAAEAAGDTLNQDTFLEGVESLGEIALPGDPAFFGPDRYAGLSEFYLFEPNPDYGGLGSGDLATLPVSDESFRVEE